MAKKDPGTRKLALALALALVVLILLMHQITSPLSVMMCPSSERASMGVYDQMGQTACMTKNAMKRRQPLGRAGYKPTPGSPWGPHGRSTGNELFGFR